jgi:hypothetical protein
MFGIDRAFPLDNLDTQVRRAHINTFLPPIFLCSLTSLPTLSLLFECLLFILTISKAISEARRNIYSPISSILYRDGILYFLAIAGCSMFCMFVWLIGTPVYAGLAK